MPLISKFVLKYIAGLLSLTIYNFDIIGHFDIRTSPTPPYNDILLPIDYRGLTYQPLRFISWQR
jgi:hypothetical protein